MKLLEKGEYDEMTVGEGLAGFGGMVIDLTPAVTKTAKFSPKYAGGQAVALCASEAGGVRRERAQHLAVRGRKQRKLRLEADGERRRERARHLAVRGRKQRKLRLEADGERRRERA